MRNPEISIIVPNFNCLQFLPRCFESIKAQQKVHYEVLFVDDGSTDGSLAYAHNIALQWPQLRILQQNRQGPGAARNFAAQVAEAPLLAFLDADDWWAHDKLAAQVKYHQQSNEMGLSFTNYEHINEQTGLNVICCFDYWPEFREYLLRDPRSTNSFEKLRDAEAMLLAENMVGTSSVVVSKSAFMAVHGFDTSLPSASDWDLWLKISKIADVGFSRDCLMYYLQRSGSVSSNYRRRFQAVDTIMARYLVDIRDIYPHKARSAKAAHAIAKHEMWQGEKQYTKALVASLTALWLKPSTRQIKTAMRDFIALASPNS